MAAGLVLWGTGHRPDKLGGYGYTVYADLYLLARQELKKREPTVVLSGMALGWDLALADAAHSLAIPFIAVIPFEGQEERWRLAWQIRYRRLRAMAHEEVVVCPGGYDPIKMQERNQWLVDNGDRGLALWNGSEGGTYNCLAYAKLVGKPWDNVWQEWEYAQASKRI